MESPIPVLVVADANHYQAGVTHVFVNLGSDHPSILEAMVKGQKEKRDQFPSIITCPNEVTWRSRSTVLSVISANAASMRLDGCTFHGRWLCSFDR